MKDQDRMQMQDNQSMNNRDHKGMNNGQMMMDGSMNNMMMQKMQTHQNEMFTIGILVLVGFVIVIVLQALMLKALRQK